MSGPPCYTPPARLVPSPTGLGTGRVCRARPVCQSCRTQRKHRASPAYRPVRFRRARVWLKPAPRRRAGARRRLSLTNARAREGTATDGPRGDDVMTTDTKLGLVVGLGVVLTVAVTYYPKAGSRG